MHIVVVMLQLNIRYIISNYYIVAHNRKRTPDSCRLSEARDTVHNADAVKACNNIDKMSRTRDCRYLYRLLTELADVLIRRSACDGSICSRGDDLSQLL